LHTNSATPDHQALESSPWANGSVDKVDDVFKGDALFEDRRLEQGRLCAGIT
jgi:hypothetical protein